MSKPKHAEASTEPVASSLPDSLLSLVVKPDDSFAATEAELQDLEIFQAACNYIAVAQIFLTWAPLDAKQLTKEHVKKRLLGHWGTCPGLSMIFAHTNYLIKQTGEEWLVVTGPGHGAPGVLSALYLEGAITRFYGKYGMDKAGLDAFVKAFSWPGGFPSHVNAETPGQIHEGGELGYALAVAYGSVMDNPDLITVAIVGDGESESATCATSWNCHRYIDPAESGAVLPILHVNGFKISERTIPGTLDDKEAVALFTGYGHNVIIVSYEDLTNPSHEHDRKLQADLFKAMHWAYAEIRAIQKEARSGKPRDKPRFPMIFLRTPKGWTGPKMVHGLPMVNSFRSHQVPLPEAKTSDEEFRQLQDWLASYHPERLFNEEGPVVKPEVLKILPDNPELRLGQTRHARPEYKALDLVKNWEEFGVSTQEEVSPMKAIGKYLVDVVKRNPKRFRIFSPDELRSNKLDAPLDITTRNFQWDPETAHKGGRVIEMLSENTLQGYAQGYALTGRYSIFPSYEAFLAIVDTMIIQFCKFTKVALETPWRTDIPSLTYIETSTLWRQEHNGYSHQAPGLINTLLTLPAHLVRVYLPPDGNTAISVIDHCLRSKNYINLVVGSKTPGQTFLSPEEASLHCADGVSVWKKFSTDEGKDPDVVLVGAGVEVTTEVIHAARILQEEAPEIRIRVVNLVDLLVLSETGLHPHALDETAFNAVFTKDKPVIINFHGYPAAVASLLFGRTSHVSRRRFFIHGYLEEGTTCTPYDMLRMNKVDRYNIAEEAVRQVAALNTKLDTEMLDLCTKFQHQNKLAEKASLETGADLDWFTTSVLREQ